MEDWWSDLIVVMAISALANSRVRPIFLQKTRPRCDSLLVFLIFRAAYRDRNYVEAATGSKLTIGTGDQDDAVALRAFQCLES